jgi:hypothetical protein
LGMAIGPEGTLYIADAVAIASKRLARPLASVWTVAGQIGIFPQSARRPCWAPRFVYYRLPPTSLPGRWEHVERALCC